MKERLAKLIDVKSIVTLVMTIGLVALLFGSVEPSKEVLALYCSSYGSVMTYYFTRKEGQSETGESNG